VPRDELDLPVTPARPREPLVLNGLDLQTVPERPSSPVP
jgi:hypothetical protein